MKVILSAGATQSGSTALYNLIRLCVKQAGFSFEGKLTRADASDLWSPRVGRDGEKLPYNIGAEEFAALKGFSKDILVLKIHEFHPTFYNGSDITFFAARNVFDAAASRQRTGFRQNTYDHATKNLHIIAEWVKRTPHTFDFRELVIETDEAVKRICAALELSGVDHNSVSHEFQNVVEEGYENTFLRQNKITDPTRKMTYKDTLDAEEIENICKAIEDVMSTLDHGTADQIQKEHRHWIEEY